MEEGWLADQYAAARRRRCIRSRLCTINHAAVVASAEAASDGAMYSVYSALFRSVMIASAKQHSNLVDRDAATT